MKRDFFAFLPSEIITNILLKLPIRSIARSKCVCKPWLDLLESGEFVNSHSAKSVPTLAVLVRSERSRSCSIFEFEEEEVDIDFESCGRRFNELTKFDVPEPGKALISGAANGLLLLHSHNVVSRSRFIESLYICNPITHEYVKLPGPKRLASRSKRGYGPTYGFGASKISGEYKVVRINTKFECHVYTLGTESWRRVETPSASFECDYLAFGAFVDGNLHWLISEGITCFDLETECFSTFSAPPIFSSPPEIQTWYKEKLCVLKGYLSVCAIPKEDEMAVWSMKEYGVEKSWTKEYSICMHPSHVEAYCSLMYPIKVFRDGDVLMAWGDLGLFYYSKKTQFARDIGMLSNSFVFTPSFLSLKSLGMENVISC